MPKGRELNVLGGVFQGRKAKFEGLTEDNRIKVLVNLLGKDFVLSMEALDLAWDNAS